MKVTIEIEQCKCTVEDDGVTMEDLYHMMKQCAVGVGFGGQTVEEWMEG